MIVCFFFEVSSILNMALKLILLQNTGFRDDNVINRIRVHKYRVGIDIRVTILLFYHVAKLIYSAFGNTDITPVKHLSSM